MFLVGAKNMRELGSVPLVVRGRTAEWLEQRGLLARLLKGRGIER
jgi:hypothetical protein